MITPELVHIEKATLGALLCNPRSRTETATLEAGDFALDSHRQLLTVIRQMDAQGLTVDSLTLFNELQRRKLTEAVGGAGYVSDLTTDHGYISGDLTEYVRIIRKESGRRKLLALCELTRARAENGDDPDQLYTELQTYALEAQTASVQVQAQHVSRLVLSTWEEMLRQREHAGEVLGIPTGLRSFDQATTGWRDGELTYVGASPGSGKTSFMLQSMYSAAREGFGVGCISLEMRGSQLMKRLLAIESGLAAYKIRDPRLLNAADAEHAKRSMFALGDLPIQICDQSGLKPAQISALARRMHSNGAKVVFCDFVQIIQEDGRDRREAINRVSAALRDTCKALNIPFVVLSQLARRGDPNALPRMSDLRESGNLEQDAHCVHMLHRPKANGEYTGEDLILIEKQREGMTGPIPVRYDPHSLTFREQSTARERAA